MNDNLVVAEVACALEATCSKIKEKCIYFEDLGKGFKIEKERHRMDYIKDKRNYKKHLKPYLAGNVVPKGVTYSLEDPTDDLKSKK